LAEAIAELEHALELDPLAGGTRYWLGIMRLLAGDHDGGIDEARAMLELEPTSWMPPLLTGLGYLQKYSEESLRGRPRPDFANRAVAGLRKAVELAPGAEHLLAWLGYALGVCGRKDEAREVLEELYRCDRYILPSSYAHLHLCLGEIDAAFAWFDRAVEERDQNMMPILSYAHFDPIRADPRFATLLDKMCLSVRRASTCKATTPFHGAPEPRDS
jgi:tetratricopeptide (TPR) repeat protein